MGLAAMLGRSASKNVPSKNVVTSGPPAGPLEIPTQTDSSTLLPVSPSSGGQGHSGSISDPNFLSASSPNLAPPSPTLSLSSALGVPASVPTSFTTGPSMVKAPIGKGDGSDTPSTVAHINPPDNNTDPTPSALKPYALAALVHPKTLKDLDTMGGLEGLCAGLGTNPTRGLSVHWLGQGAGDGEKSCGECAFAAPSSDRQRLYGTNPLPTRPSKSLALKDKVLVC